MEHTLLFDFLDPGRSDGWLTLNDPVMGGLSSSTVATGAHGLVFSGTISLENNGGFASLRSPEDPGLGRRAAGASALRVRARGDGKTYAVQVGVDGQPWAYVQRFATAAGVERVYDLPVDRFQAVDMFLNPVPAAPQQLDPSNADQICVYILDKQQGAFELTIASIDAVI